MVFSIAEGDMSSRTPKRLASAFKKIGSSKNCPSLPRGNRGLFVSLPEDGLDFQDDFSAPANKWESRQPDSAEMKP